MWGMDKKKGKLEKQREHLGVQSRVVAMETKRRERVGNNFWRCNQQDPRWIKIPAFKGCKGCSLHRQAQ